MEVAFLLDRPYWARGLATEAARASVLLWKDHVDEYGACDVYALLRPVSSGQLRDTPSR